MSQFDLLFLVMFLIAIASLTLFIVQVFRSRRGGSENDRSGWWEGPWSDDDRSR